MIWHILLATLLTWLVLLGLDRVASYLWFDLAGEDKETPATIVFLAALLLAPCAVPDWLIRRLIPRRRRIVTVDMRVLSKDEQQQWIERLNSDEPTEQVVREAIARAREVQETIK